MLRITVTGTEVYDEETQEFSTQGDIVLDLEHSLVSISKWESKFEKPFLSHGEKTSEEVLFYVECMNLTPEIAPEVFSKLSKENHEAISKYIESKMSATWFSEIPGAPKSSEVITSELIYYWLVAFTIPFECQYWHINRLFNLIKICNLKNAKPKQMSRSELAARNRELNAQRKAQLGTTG